MTGYFQRFAEIVVSKGLDDESVAVLNAAIKAVKPTLKCILRLAGFIRKRNNMLPRSTCLKGVQQRS